MLFPSFLPNNINCYFIVAWKKSIKYKLFWHSLHFFVCFFPHRPPYFFHPLICVGGRTAQTPWHKTKNKHKDQSNQYIHPLTPPAKLCSCSSPPCREKNPLLFPYSSQTFSYEYMNKRGFLCVRSPNYCTITVNFASFDRFPSLSTA